MDTHPDIIALAAISMYLERIAAAQRANLTNQARRLHREQTRRPSLAERVARLAAVRRRRPTRRRPTPPPIQATPHLDPQRS
jgi:hypothetical protein